MNRLVRTSFVGVFTRGTWHLGESHHFGENLHILLALMGVRKFTHKETKLTDVNPTGPLQIMK